MRPFLILFIIQAVFFTEVIAQRNTWIPTKDNLVSVRPISLTPFTEKSKPNNHRINGNKSLPLTSHRYLWDSSAWSQSYVLIKNTYSASGVILKSEVIHLPNQVVYMDSVAYDAHGNKIFQGNYTLNPGTNKIALQSGAKYLYTYNALNQVIELITEDFQGGLTNPWLQVSRTTYQYTLNGKLQQSSSYSRFNNSWHLGGKSCYTYNANDQILSNVDSLYDLNTNTLKPGNRYAYTYNSASALDEIIYQEFNSGNWQNERKYTNFTFQIISSDTLKGLVSQIWVNNNWVNDGKANWLNDSYGGSIRTIQGWNAGSWVNAMRNFTTYDSQSNLIGYKSEEWINNAWVGEYQILNFHTYNSNNDLVETITKELDFFTNSHVNLYKEVFLTHLLISSSNPEMKEPEFGIFPNPTSDFLRIAFKNKASARIQLIDLTGRIVKTESLTTYNSRIDISALPKGIYLLNIQTEKGSQTSKIVKQ